jgi:hypothetical protein
LKGEFLRPSSISVARFSPRRFLWRSSDLGCVFNR